MLEQLDGIVPLHVQVAGACFFPNAHELLEGFLILAVGLFQNFVCFDRLALANHADGVKGTVDEVAFDQIFLRVFANLDVGAVLLGGTFKTGGEVHGITHHGVVLTHRRTHVARHDIAGVDTDSHVHVVHDGGPLVVFGNPFLAQGNQLSLHFDSGFAGTLGVVRERHRRAEECDNGITFVLVESSLVFEQGVCHCGQVFIQQVNEFTRVANLFGEGGETCNVGKVGCDVRFFTTQSRHDFVFHHGGDQFGRNVLFERVVDEVLFFVFKVELHDQCRNTGQQHRQQLLGGSNVESALEILVSNKGVNAHQYKG